MDIILIPGLWLNGSSWDAVTPLLERDGHRVTALTLPGMVSKDADRAGITVRDHIDAVVAAVDAADGPVLLVAHSAGGDLGHAAVDARPDKVARVVYVGGFPGPDGSVLLKGLPAQNGEVGMPDWKEMGEDANIVDFDDEALARLYAEAVPVPEAVLTTPVRLGDERRYDVPVTAVCPEYRAADLRGWVEDGSLPELARIRDVRYVDLPGGHWPQFTQPEKLARVLLDEAARG
jgi:pimeloyl-ACP methyl ester carboxylesterase